MMRHTLVAILKTIIDKFNIKLLLCITINISAQVIIHRHLKFFTCTTQIIANRKYIEFILNTTFIEYYILESICITLF